MCARTVFRFGLENFAHRVGTQSLPERSILHYSKYNQENLI